MGPAAAGDGGEVTVEVAMEEVGEAGLEVGEAGGGGGGKGRGGAANANAAVNASGGGGD